MLRVYIGNIDKSSEKYCEYNDAWFDKYLDKIKFNQNIIKIIRVIDKVTYLGNQRVESKFIKDTAISVKELSSGCKTAINIINFTSNIFSVAECGDNALQVIFNFKSGNLYIPYFIIPKKFNNEIEVNYNSNKIIVHNNIELERILNQVF